MATPPCAISDNFLEVTRRHGDGTAGKEEPDGQALLLRAAPGRQAPCTIPDRVVEQARDLGATMEKEKHETKRVDASSSSSSRSLAHQASATPWVIIDRYLDTAYDGRHELTGAETQAEAQQAAARPDLTLTLALALPPGITIVSAGPAHPDHPFVLCATNLGLLLEFTAPSSARHLMLARRFNTADGQATVERLTDRTSDIPALTSFESIVLSSNDNGDYFIAELLIDDEFGDFARLIYLESRRDEWGFKIMELPLRMFDSKKKEELRDRKWVPHGSASDDRMLWWFDLSWGMLSYDTSVSITEGELFFHELPDGRALDQSTRDIHSQRCIMLSKKKLRYVEIIREEESAILIMWTWSCIPPPGWHWIKRYEMRFEQLWNSNSYQSTKLPREVPVLSVVSPLDPDLVYFALGQHVFGVNVPELRVVHYGAYQLVNVPGLPRLASARYLIPWELPSALGQGPLLHTCIKLGHNSTAANDERISSRTQKDDTIFTVWNDNLDYAFSKIQKLMRIKTNWIIGMDTEFCQQLPELAWNNPAFGDQSYAHMRRSVDEGDLVQVGLAIADWDYHQGTDVFEFNLHFDPTARPHNSKGVAFLKENNPHLEEHAVKGIVLDGFTSQLRKCGVLQNTAVTWVTYQGFADYGYLLRALEGVERMPESRGEFLNSVENIFPKNYDLKTFQHMGICCEIPKKGSRANLESLSENLKAERRGTAHTAGSDALLTLQCFYKMAARELPFDRNPMLKWQGVLFRVCPTVPRDLLSCDRNVRVVSVDSRNIEMEGTEMKKLFPFFGIVSAELKFTTKEQIRTGNYETACQELARLAVAEVAIAFSNPQGWPAHGRVWRFNINNGYNCITSQMLVQLLTKVGAVSNPGITWVSSEVGFFLHMVNELTTSSLPSNRHQFNTLFLGFFPKLYVLPEPGEDSECDPGLKVIPTLRKFLLMKASGLELRKPLF